MVHILLPISATSYFYLLNYFEQSIKLHIHIKQHTTFITAFYNSILKRWIWSFLWFKITLNAIKMSILHINKNPSFKFATFHEICVLLITLLLWCLFILPCFRTWIPIYLNARYFKRFQWIAGTTAFYFRTLCRKRHSNLIHLHFLYFYFKQFRKWEILENNVSRQLSAVFGMVVIYEHLTLSSLSWTKGTFHKMV